MSANERQSLDQFYDSLWEKAEHAFHDRALRLDPHLKDKNADRRRGLSLILRPGIEAAREVEACVEELKKIEPNQYYYASREYHVTVLSLLTGSVEYHRNDEQIEAYEAAIARAIAGLKPFKIQFRGITATDEAVMIQGFPEDASLSAFRNRVLHETAVSRVAVQQRYTPQAAHMTIARYSQPCEDLPGWADKLRSLRSKPFGTGEIQNIFFVENDWYMSHDKLRILRAYDLPG